MSQQKPVGQLTSEEMDAVLQAAKQARSRAYAPYSRFTVGAALLDTDGGVHPGANVENASYGLCTCAERSAISRAVSDGVTTFKAVGVVGPQEAGVCLPCGSCRQILHEFAPDLVVVTEDGQGEAHQVSLRDLLPSAFGPESLHGFGGSAG